jgi:chromate transporter
MIRRELVDEERWISPARFNRTLAVYQVLPGPEAHELCVFFGLLVGGRPGGILAGLGFMLPGFLLMLALSVFYVSVGLGSPIIAALFAGAQVGVVALVARAVQHIGRRALKDGWLFALAGLAAGAELAGAHFAIVLACCGTAYAFARRRRVVAAMAVAALLAVVSVVFALRPRALRWDLTPSGSDPMASALRWDLTPSGSDPMASSKARAPAVLASGLKAGLLTFGGAYTAIPFVRRDAVEREGWLSDRQFLDGLALGGVLPAPLIIFGTFVGYVAGGLAGALAMTAGIFLPAFAISLVGHETLERIVQNRALHDVLDGITAGVVGLIAATTVHLFRAGVDGFREVVLFAMALAVLYLWRSRAAVAVVVLGSAAVGLLLWR